jgi:pyrrolidone-carboxylate peptidase
MNTPILVYGFEPFLQYRANVTEAIANTLGNTPGFVTQVFPVVFNQEQFCDALHEAAPSIVIGMGQDSRARKIRLERKAVNWMCDRERDIEGDIRNEGPETLFCTAPVVGLPETTVTYDAGSYVCNFSMYICLEYCIPRGIPYQFLHIPVNYDVTLGVSAVRTIISMLR